MGRVLVNSIRTMFLKQEKASGDADYVELENGVIEISNPEETANVAEEVEKENQNINTFAEPEETTENPASTGDTSKHSFFMTPAERRLARMAERKARFLESLKRDEEERERLRLLEQEGNNEVHPLFKHKQKCDPQNASSLSVLLNTPFLLLPFPLIPHCNPGTLNSVNVISSSPLPGLLTRIASIAATTLPSAAGPTNTSEETNWHFLSFVKSSSSRRLFIELLSRSATGFNNISKQHSTTILCNEDVDRYLDLPLVIDCLHQLDVYFPKFNFDGLKSMYRRTLLRRLKSYQVSNSQMDSSDNSDVAPCCSTWAEIYRPLCCNELWNNKDIGRTVRDWLATFNSADTESPQQEVDIDLATATSGDDEMEDLTTALNVDISTSTGLLLLGNIGSGKTAMAYACAKDQDMFVLELNTSQRRNAKEVLTICAEATQSHRVKMGHNISFDALASNDTTSPILPPQFSNIPKNDSLPKKRTRIKKNKKQRKKMEILTIDDGSSEHSESDSKFETGDMILESSDGDFVAPVRLHRPVCRTNLKRPRSESIASNTRRSSRNRIPVNEEDREDLIESNDEIVEIALADLARVSNKTRKQNGGEKRSRDSNESKGLPGVKQVSLAGFFLRNNSNDSKVEKNLGGIQNEIILHSPEKPALTQNTGLETQKEDSQMPSAPIPSTMGDSNSTHNANHLARFKSGPNASLLLFDDVDIVFDDDTNFHRTIRNLLSSAKRPLLLTAKTFPPAFDDTNIITLQMSSPDGDSVDANNVVLSLLLCIMAQCGPSNWSELLQVCFHLLSKFKGDIRKTFGHLQLFSNPIPIESLLLSARSSTTVKPDHFLVDRIASAEPKTRYSYRNAIWGYYSLLDYVEDISTLFSLPQYSSPVPPLREQHAISTALENHCPVVFLNYLQAVNHWLVPLKSFFEISSEFATKNADLSSSQSDQLVEQENLAYSVPSQIQSKSLYSSYTSEILDQMARCADMISSSDIFSQTASTSSHTLPLRYLHHSRAAIPPLYGERENSGYPTTDSFKSVSEWYWEGAGGADGLYHACMDENDIDEWITSRDFGFTASATLQYLSITTAAKNISNIYTRSGIPSHQGEYNYDDIQLHKQWDKRTTPQRTEFEDALESCYLNLNLPFTLSNSLHWKTETLPLLIRMIKDEKSVHDEITSSSILGDEEPEKVPARSLRPTTRRLLRIANISLAPESRMRKVLDLSRKDWKKVEMALSTNHFSSLA